MSSRKIFMLVVAGLLGANPLAAQLPALGTLEIGMFGQYTDFRENAGCICRWPGDSPGFGGRVAAFYNPVVSLELDAARTNADLMLVGGSMTYTTISSRVTVNHFLDDLTGPSFFAGAGPMVGMYEDADRRYGVSGAAGIRYGVLDQFALRLDGTADYMPSQENLNLAVRAGGSMMLGFATAAVAPLPPAPTPAPPPTQRDPTQPPAPPRASTPLTTSDISAIVAPVYFDFDRAEIRHDGVAVLEIKVPWLLANPDLTLLLEGNADDRGTTSYNIPLGMERAISVRDFLMGRGIGADRIEITSFGNTRLLCTTEPVTEACNQMNRRVDFRIIGDPSSVRVPE